jgi:hypothetical protein
LLLLFASNPFPSRNIGAHRGEAGEAAKYLDKKTLSGEQMDVASGQRESGGFRLFDGLLPFFRPFGWIRGL